MSKHSNRLMLCASIFLAALASATWPSNAIGQNGVRTAALPKSVARFFSEDLEAIAVVDLNRADPELLMQLMHSAGLQEDPDLDEISKKVGASLKALSNSGVDRLYLMTNMQGLLPSEARAIVNEHTFWIAPVNQPDKADAAANALTKLHESLGINSEPDMDDQVVMGGFTTQSIKQRLLSPQAAVDSGVSAAIESLVKYEFGIAIIGSKNTRQVLLELSPELPKPFEEISGQIIAENIHWCGVGVSLADQKGKLLIQCNNEDTPRLLQKVTPQIGTFLETHFKLDAKLTNYVAAEFNPTVSGNRFEVDLSYLVKKDGLAPIAGELAKVRNRQQHLAKLREIATGLHAYEVANRKLPAAANYDEAGRPLLSWRVHILPYVNQRNLYKLFRLDEPWDSEHNLKLMTMLPVCYCAADDSQQNKQAGKTVFLRPTGDNTLCVGTEGATFGSMTDGSVNTVMIVRASPNHAVQWTKPADWEYDAKAPWKGLGIKEAAANESQALEIVTADGAAHVIGGNITDDQLRNLVDPADGNVINMNALK